MDARRSRCRGPIVAALILGILPASARAGLDLTWNACNLAPGHAVEETFPCGDPTAEHTLFGCFQLPSGYPFAEAMDAIIDFQTPSPELGSFWHFETGGCNQGQLQPSIAWPPSCSGVAAWPWNFRWRLIAFDYQAGSGGANRARLSLTIDDQGIHGAQSLQADVNYVAFTLTFTTLDAAESGGPCQGCVDPMVLTWSQATIHTTFGYPPLTLTEGGKVSPCVTVNGASPACAATAARRHTWGEIKAVYR